MPTQIGLHLFSNDEQSIDNLCTIGNNDYLWVEGSGWLLLALPNSLDQTCSNPLLHSIFGLSQIVCWVWPLLLGIVNDWVFSFLAPWSHLPSPHNPSSPSYGTISLVVACLMRLFVYLWVILWVGGCMIWAGLLAFAKSFVASFQPASTRHQTQSTATLQ